MDMEPRIRPLDDDRRRQVADVLRWLSSEASANASFLTDYPGASPVQVYIASRIATLPEHHYGCMAVERIPVAQRRALVPWVLSAVSPMWRWTAAVTPFVAPLQLAEWAVAVEETLPPAVPDNEPDEAPGACRPRGVAVSTDAKAHQPEKQATALRAAADLIEPEGAWFQGEYALDAWSYPCSPLDEDAVCWCAMGAIRRVLSAPDDNVDVMFLLMDALLRDFGSQDIDVWNDAPGRTQGEVVAYLRKVADDVEEGKLKL